MEWNKLLSSKTKIERKKEPKEFYEYPISYMEIDYEQIISSSAFRRLQDKTQVFPLDKSDFVRTRLTHSIEVSSIARQLGIMIQKTPKKYSKELFKDEDKVVIENIPSILACAGLLHDIGNPPFGHFGETVIGDWFKKELEKDNFTFNKKPIKKILNEQMRKDLENFEGNAQALRILTKLHSNGNDINLSYSILNTLLKYPTDSTSFSRKEKNIKKHKLGYYYSENDIVKDICQTTGTEIKGEYVRHPLTFLLEAADDIAYATADLEDAFKKGLFTIEQFIDYYQDEISKIENKKIDCIEQIFVRLKEKIKNNTGYINDYKSEISEFEKIIEDNRKIFFTKEILVDLKERIKNDVKNVEDDQKKKRYKKRYEDMKQFIDYCKNEISKIKTEENNKEDKIKILDDLNIKIENNAKNVEDDFNISQEEKRMKTNEDIFSAFQKCIDFIKKWLMYAVLYRFYDSFDSIREGVYKYDLFYDTFHEHTIKILKGAMKKFVFNNNDILKLELSAKKIIEALLNDFIYAVRYWNEDNDNEKMSKSDKKYINIISQSLKDEYIKTEFKDESEKLYSKFMMVIDFISGMTDSYAKNLYQELYGIY